jgi:hypothetical protein
MLKTLQYAQTLCIVVGLGVIGACSDPPAVGEGEGEGEGEGGEGEGEPLPPPPFAISTKGELAWKRHRAFERDLLAGLSLNKAELCSELGLYSCVDFVHTVPLGGNEPFVKSQYEPLATPTVTTPIAVERVVLSGCITRVDRDAAGDADVFTDIDLGATSVTDVEADATASTLGRRLLQRDLTDVEAALIRELTDDGDGGAVGARDFAVAACFTIGSMAETLFY